MTCSSCKHPLAPVPDRFDSVVVATRARRRLGGARGFTILELLTVVIIIGVFASAASVSFTELMRDRQLNRSALEVSGVYRLARYRAIGRGTAVTVRWRPDPTPERIRLEVREARVESVAGSIIARSCLNVTNWSSPLETELVTGIGFKQQFLLNSAPGMISEVQLRDPAGVAQATADICFTARGRTFIRYSPGGVFTPLLGVPRIDIRNTRTNLVRSVFIPPNGIARLAL